MKSRRIVISFLIILFLLSTNVYGAIISGSLSLTTEASTTAVKQGETFTVTFSISGVDSSSPITGIDGCLYIAPEVYEEITINSITSLIDGLQVVDALELTAETFEDDVILVNLNNRSSGIYYIAIDYAEGITKDTEIFEIELTVKEDVKDGIYYGSVVSEGFYIASNDTDLLYVDDSDPIVLIGDVTIDSGSSGSGSGSSSGDETGSGSGSTGTGTSGDGSDADDESTGTGSNADDDGTSEDDESGVLAGSSGSGSSTSGTGSSSTSSSEYDSTVASGSLPNTGFKLLIVPIIALIAIGIVCYKKYNDYKEIG